MARSILGIVAGYVVFALSAALLFRSTGRDPHAPAGWAFIMASVAWGIFFAALGGYLAALLARRKSFASIWVAGLIALGALVSLVSRPGKGAIWSQLSALLLMSPAAIVGGRLRHE